MGNKIVFKSNINIGQNGAENDDLFLFKCFVDHEALAVLSDVTNPTMFAVGSTGSGKTALLRMLARQKDNASELELQDMAMNYIANSDSIAFMQSLGVDLSLFFQTLWRHVICIEYIKLLASAETKDKFQYKLRKLIDGVRNAASQKKLNQFIEKNENNFWNTIDANIIEFTDAFSQNIKAEFGAEVEKSSARAGYARGLSGEKRTQYQQRAKRFVDSGLVAELGHITNALSEVTRTSGDEFFLIIDRLDEPWVDDSIKFYLIQALFEALKSFQKLRRFKFVAALRSDIFERMVRESRASSAQIEKYSDFIVRLRWSKQQLLDLANRRISFLFHRQYSSDNVFFSDVFKQQIDSRQNVWSYMVERTLYRPRDIINFINLTLQAAEGKSSVSKSDFLRGEYEYSNLRAETLVYEWRSTFPGISVLMDTLKSRPPYFDAANLMTTDLTNFIFDGMGADAEKQKDDIWIMINKSLNGSSLVNPNELAARVLQRLHLIGAVGIKTDPEAPWNYVYLTNRHVATHAIQPSSKVSVHPMLHRALNNTEPRKGG